MKLFKPKGKGFFNKDSLAIIDIKNINGTDGIIVTYKDGNQVVYENYDKIVDRKGLIKETFTTALSSFEKLNNLKDEIINNIQIGDIIYYNGEFIIIDNNILNELNPQIINTTNILDIFKDGSCVACYTFDGNANDLSGNYNGVWSGTEQYGDGKFGQSAYFDGNSQIIVRKLLGNEKIFTISIWFKNITYSTDFAGLFYFYKNGDGIKINDYSISITNDDYIQLRSLDNNLNGIDEKIIKIDGIYNNNNWINLIAISDFESGNLKLYINGELKYNDNVLNTSWETPFFLSTIGTSQRFSTGYIDQIRLFNKELTENEIQIIYNEQIQTLKKLSF